MINRCCVPYNRRKPIAINSYSLTGQSVASNGAFKFDVNAYINGIKHIEETTEFQIVRSGTYKVSVGSFSSASTIGITVNGVLITQLSTNTPGIMGGIVELSACDVVKLVNIGNVTSTTSTTTIPNISIIIERL